MAAKLTPQQQRDRRAKIMLAVLGVVFLGVMGMQLPKLMGGGGGSSSAAPAPTTTSSSAVLAAAPVHEQLTQFSRFAVKDPFHARVALPAATASTSTTPAPQPAPKQPSAATKPTKPLTISVTTTPSAAALPTVPAALVLVNGKKRVVALDALYPAKHPLFRVVALGEKAVWIQLVGGSLANGQQTIKLDRGRRITLLNTTAALRVVLQLVKPTTAPKPAVASPAGG